MRGPQEEEPTTAPADLRQAELRLRRAETRYRTLIEHLPAVIFQSPLDDFQGELYISPQIEALLGFTADEWLGDSLLWYKQIHPEDRERMQVEFARVCQGKESVGVDHRLLTRDGRTVWVHGEMKVVQDTDGQPGYLQGIIYDITERKGLEKALREKNLALENALLAKDRFLASMSHELRTPLNAIIGFTGTLLMKLPGPLTADQDKQLRIVQTSARHLLSLINDLLDLAKIEAGKVELSLEGVVCQEVIEEVAATLRPLAQNKGLALEVNVPAGDLLVRTDRRTLSQILMNLANNAIKFTERGGVRLDLQRRPTEGGTRVEISVADTGAGIRPEDRAQLFQAFEQGTGPGHRHEGTGLGLYLSQKLAGLLGGRITCDSDCGKGSIFTLVLTET